jgi:hypothetical protein
MDTYEKTKIFIKKLNKFEVFIAMVMNKSVSWDVNP